MRIYKTDGSFVEDSNDTEFGWFCSDIVIDESRPNYSEINKQTKELSKVCKSLQKVSFNSSLESINFIPEETPMFVEENKPILRLIPPDLMEDTPTMSTVLSSEEFRDISSEKERLARSITPCNAEAKMLLSVVYYTKYKSLLKQETSEELLKTVNFKTTNFKCLTGETVSDNAQHLYEEVMNYHETKEENMLSLMMELILADAECTVKDLVEAPSCSNQSNQPIIPKFVIETSDLGNSIHSSDHPSTESKERIPIKNFLQIPSDRSNILSSIGLSEEEKSIQNFCEETYVMQQELVDIRRSFQDLERRVDSLIKSAQNMESELKETLYLEDIVNLLKGDLEKIKLKKLPFKIFHKNTKEPDLII